jgi:hypothetical protein
VVVLLVFTVLGMEVTHLHPAAQVWVAQALGVVEGVLLGLVWALLVAQASA